MLLLLHVTVNNHVNFRLVIQCILCYYYGL